MFTSFKVLLEKCHLFFKNNDKTVCLQQTKSVSIIKTIWSHLVITGEVQVLC